MLRLNKTIERIQNDDPFSRGIQTRGFMGIFPPLGIRKSFEFLKRNILTLGRSIYNAIPLRLISPIVSWRMNKLLQAIQLKEIESRGYSDSGMIGKERRTVRVLQINTFDNYGGAAKVAWRLHGTFNAASPASTLFVKRKLSQDDRVISIDNPRGNRRFRLLCFLEGLQYWNYLSTFDISGSDEFRRADIVHFHNLHGNFFNYFALPSLTRWKPSIWTLHDMQALTGHCAVSMGCEKWETGCGDCPMLDAYPAMNRDNSHLLWKKKKELFGRSRITLVVPSRWLLNIAKRSLFSDKEVHLIYNGIDHEIFRPYPKEVIRERLQIPPGKPVLVTCSVGGAKNPYKGSDHLLSVLRRMGKIRDVVCVSIGEKNFNPGIKGVEWINTGHLFDEAEIAMWYSAGDLFIYPTLADNCPLVVLEAMACGLPVISFKTGGIPELVRHMTTGYVADYLDGEDLFRGVETFLNDKALMRSASRAGRIEIEKNFTLKRMVDDYTALYEKVIVDWGKSEIASLL